MYAKWFNNNFEFTLGDTGIGVSRNDNGLIKEKEDKMQQVPM